MDARNYAPGSSIFPGNAIFQVSIFISKISIRVLNQLTIEYNVFSSHTYTQFGLNIPKN